MDSGQLRKMNIAQVRTWLGQVGALDRQALSLLEQDSRAGVRALAGKWRRQEQGLKAEKERQQHLLVLERRWWGKKVEWVAGVDEVGRGCLAGPVVAAAVVLPVDIVLDGLDDSKKLKPEKREALSEAIGRMALAIGIGQVEAEEIDRLNILQAALKAMRLALESLGGRPGHVLIDGNQKPGSPFPETAVVDGDARSLSIAAASVVAKVYRDRLMSAMDVTWPTYGFARHKGYGSPEHLAALEENGPCPLHRRSFGPVAARCQASPSENFLVFREGLEESRSMAELERMAALVKEAQKILSDYELERLRSVYKSRRRFFTDTGTKGEYAAARYIEQAGYRVLERNYKAAGGEIDLIVRRNAELVFIEVKTSRHDATGHPEERIGKDKEERLRRAASHYLARQSDLSVEYRFDVLALTLGDGQIEVRHLENALTR
jgi:ribonuclease HII